MFFPARAISPDRTALNSLALFDENPRVTAAGAAREHSRVGLAATKDSAFSSQEIVFSKLSTSFSTANWFT